MCCTSRSFGGTTITERRVTVLMSSSPTLEESKSARVLPTETLTTEAQDAGAGGGARHCVFTTRTIESSGRSRRPVVHGSDGIITGVRRGFLGVLGRCAVDLTAQQAAIGEVVVRVGGYAGVVHGVGYVCQSAIVAGIMLGLTA